MKTKLVISAIVLFLVGCGGGTQQSVVIGPDPAVGEGVEFITLRAIDEEGVSQVEIPLSVFGDSEEALQNATIDIRVNDYLRNKDIDPNDYFVDIVGRVAFYMQGLEDGDEIMFSINLLMEGAEVANLSINAELPVADPVVETESAGDVVTLLFKGTFSSTEDTAALLEVEGEEAPADTFDPLTDPSNVTITPIF